MVFQFSTRTIEVFEKFELENTKLLSEPLRFEKNINTFDLVKTYNKRISI